MKTNITARIRRVAEPRPDTKNNTNVGHLDSKNKKIHSILSIEFRI